jgi:UDP-GlcNAc:undecaprenyl-phosphate GlcNAc-1-phosphate transferase
MFYFFLASIVISAALTPLVIILAKKYSIVDFPNLANAERKIHKQAVPLMGGLAIFLSFFIVLFFSKEEITGRGLEFRHWLGFFIGSLIIMAGGILDDKWNLKASRQLIWPILAVISAILGGISITRITNPSGGVIDFSGFSSLVSYLLTFAWLMLMMYTTKLLDGIDGLVTGISAIGAIIIFLFTITTRYFQPDIGLASLILAGSCLGFLLFNFNPAKIFLGEGGSLFLGYALGILAIISGGKIAIALLVMGIPILDMFWAIIRRILKKKNPFSYSDKDHLHHKLLAFGLSQKKAVFVYYILAIFFGILGLFLQSRGKIIALAGLLVIMFFLVIYLNRNVRS